MVKSIKNWQLKKENLILVIWIKARSTKKPVGYSAFTEGVESSHKPSKVKVGDRAGITRIILVKVLTKIGQEKYLLLILC